jgi:formiminoglutamase
MSDASSSAVGWSTRLVPPRPPEGLPGRPDDPRLGEVIEPWRGDPAALRPDRAVLIGFPQDEGVRRNGGRPGAAEAPGEIRRWLYRLTAADPAVGIDLAPAPPLDVGDVRVAGSLEESQQALADVVAAVLRHGAVPVVLGGGHETAYGHFLGYVSAGVPVGIINMDAHLDVRPLVGGRGHSGSPFRQAMEHPTRPLPGSRYCCLGVQPHATSREHLRYALDRGCVVRWCGDVRAGFATHLAAATEDLAAAGCRSYVTVDADVARHADVPGVSAPNPGGVNGTLVIDCARAAGITPHVAGFDLVEINPRHDRDGQSARWGAVVVWNFLIGLAGRRPLSPA